MVCKCSFFTSLKINEPFLTHTCCCDGLSYYSGCFVAGDQIEFRQNKDNEKDANEVMIQDTNCIQIGYLQRRDAELMAPIIDCYRSSTELQYLGNMISDGNWLQVNIFAEFFCATNNKQQMKDIKMVVKKLLNGTD